MSFTGPVGLSDLVGYLGCFKGNRALSLWKFVATERFMVARVLVLTAKEPMVGGDQDDWEKAWHDICSGRLERTLVVDSTVSFR